jgi:hypothetical protein
MNMDHAIQAHIGQYVRLDYDRNLGNVTLTGDGFIIRGEPVGDCCAVTTICDVVGDGAEGTLVGSTRHDYQGYDNTTADVVDVFAVVVTLTVHGSDEDALILCTCSHNGYYGGWIEWSEVAARNGSP